MTFETTALLNYGVLGVVLVLLLTGMLVTRGHLEVVRGFADRAMSISEKQVEATDQLAKVIEEAVAELRRSAQRGGT